MHELFEDKVAPPIIEVLNVLDQIRASNGQKPDPGELRSRIRSMIGQLSARGHDSEQHHLARRALVAWIDEVLINSRWHYANQWKDLPLEREDYLTRERAWAFFEQAESARGLDKPDALEVYALCVALGFQGIYRSGSLQAGRAHESGEKTASETGGGKVAAKVRREAAVTVPGEAGDASVSKAESRQHRIFSVYEKLPPSLDEWTRVAFGQIRAKPLSVFSPALPFDSARSARPLYGAQVLRRWGIVLLLVVAVTLAVISMTGW